MNNDIEAIAKNPEYIEKLKSDQVEILLKDIRCVLEGLDEFPLLRFNKNVKHDTILYFAGDTHGDLKISRWIINNILKPAIQDKTVDTKVIFLGDYVDRAPDDVPFGGVKNVLYLLCQKVLYPEHLFLLCGNHEGYVYLPFAPYGLKSEVGVVWGVENANNIHDGFLKIFSKLPIFVLTSNGVFAAHGGFPREKSIFDVSTKDKDAILQTIWCDPSDFTSYRGPIINSLGKFTQKDTITFLEKINAKVMLRGHYYSTSGCAIYQDSVLTIFSSRRYANKGAGGVLLVKMKLSDKINYTSDLELLEISNDKLKKKSIKSM